VSCTRLGFGGGLYAAALLAISIVRFRRIVYRLNR